MELLAGCHRRDLQKLADLRGRARCLFLYRCCSEPVETFGNAQSSLCCLLKDLVCGAQCSL